MKNDKQWTVTSLNDYGEIHVMPNDDILEHTFDPDCKCNPSKEELNGWLIVSHTAMDGRVGMELANEILNPDE